MAELLKKITLDGAELDVCDDTARAAATSNSTKISSNTNAIADLTTEVNNLKTKSSVNITYDSSSSALVISHN